MQQDHNVDLAVVNVPKDEADSLWQTGFYIFRDAAKVENALKTLT